MLRNGIKFFMSLFLYSPILLGTGIGTFSILDGCQWVLEPVSRHFFINQDSEEF